MNSQGVFLYIAVIFCPVASLPLILYIMERFSGKLHESRNKYVEFEQHKVDGRLESFIIRQDCLIRCSQYCRIHNL